MSSSTYILALTFKGSKSKREVESKGFHNIHHYGVGRNVFKNDADAIKFVQHLITNDILTENIFVLAMTGLPHYLLPLVRKQAC